MLRILAILAGVLAALCLGLWLVSRPPVPGAFYAGGDLSGQPGRLLAQEPYAHVPQGMTGWRILYETSDGRGQARRASAIVLKPTGAEGPLPLLVWAHGTSGIVPGCAPSLRADIWKLLPAADQLAQEGWAVVAPDYAGLGTAGPHGYLVGLDEARSVLDAIRAARQAGDVTLNGSTVVWGHSQGGHAALWAGIEADYAPDITLDGIAALAPATDLPRLIDSVKSSAFGKIVSAYVVESYSEIYGEVDFRNEVRTGLYRLTRDMAGRCVGGFETVASVAEGLLISREGVLRPGTEGSLLPLLAQNRPDGPIAAPVFIGQGAADTLVLPEVQTDWVATRCGAGQGIDYRTYAERDHLSLLAVDSPMIDDLLTFTRARFAAELFTATCH